MRDDACVARKRRHGKRVCQKLAKGLEALCHRMRRSIENIESWGVGIFRKRIPYNGRRIHNPTLYGPRNQHLLILEILIERPHTNPSDLCDAIGRKTLRAFFLNHKERGIQNRMHHLTTPPLFRSLQHERNRQILTGVLLTKMSRLRHGRWGINTRHERQYLKATTTRYDLRALDGFSLYTFWAPRTKLRCCTRTVCESSPGFHPGGLTNVCTLLQMPGAAHASLNIAAHS